MPGLEVITQLLIEHAGSDLEQPMCTGHRPSHLLLLDEPLADDLVEGRLDKAGRDGLAAPMTIGVIRDRRHVGHYVVHEFLKFILKRFGTWRLGSDIPGQLVKRTQRPMRTAMPEVGLGAAQLSRKVFYTIR